MKLYSNALSGNCYKVRLLLAQLGVEYELETLDVIDRSNRPDVLGGLNPALRVPTLVLDSATSRSDDGRPLGESAAILLYLAEGTEYLPSDRYERALVAQWLFFEQYEIEPKIAVARFKLEIAPGEADPAQIAELQAAGQKALSAMEEHLAGGREWFVADRYTIADIALNGYTHVAGEAGIDLAGYPNVQAWHRRITEQPGWVAMTA